MECRCYFFLNVKWIFVNRFQNGVSLHGTNIGGNVL